MIRKHVQKFGNNWDKFLPGLLWAYRNVPHDSTGEKPSFFLFGYNCRSPTEAALAPVTTPQPTQLEDYRQEIILSLSFARDLAAVNIQKAHSRYKKSHDKSYTHEYKIGRWIFICFPQEQTGAKWKLSRPWHGLYRVKTVRGPNIVASKVYFPDDGTIQVHLSRVCGCPTDLLGGFHWYGRRRAGPGRGPIPIKPAEPILTILAEDTESVEPDVTTEELATC